MKILVLSDSHSARSFMRLCVEKVRPDAIVHLGDHHADGEALAEEYPQYPMYQVPGNCDAHRGFIRDPEIRTEKICGVWLYLTHGHRHNVKLSRYSLLADARAAGVQAALYGHTHQADCYQEPDGLWVLNPGAAGSYGGSAGLMEVQDGSIRSCCILRYEDLEKM